MKNKQPASELSMSLILEKLFYLMDNDKEYCICQSCGRIVDMSLSGVFLDEEAMVCFGPNTKIDIDSKNDQFKITNSSPDNFDVSGMVFVSEACTACCKHGFDVSHGTEVFRLDITRSYLVCFSCKTIILLKEDPVIKNNQTNENFSSEFPLLVTVYDCLVCSQDLGSVFVAAELKPIDSSYPN